MSTEGRGITCKQCKRFVPKRMWDRHAICCPAFYPIRSGDLIATGTGAARRRLTLEEAAAGGKPERMTPEEWAAMAKASKGAA